MATTEHTNSRSSIRLPDICYHLRYLLSTSFSMCIVVFLRYLLFALHICYVRHLCFSLSSLFAICVILYSMLFAICVIYAICVFATCIILRIANVTDSKCLAFILALAIKMFPYGLKCQSAFLQRPVFLISRAYRIL